MKSGKTLEARYWYGVGVMLGILGTATCLLIGWEIGQWVVNTYRAATPERQWVMLHRLYVLCAALAVVYVIPAILRRIDRRRARHDRY